MAYIEDYDLAIGAVTLAQFGGMSNRPYTSYAQGRRVCGLAAGVSGAAIYALPDGRQMRLSAGEAALIPAASRYTVRAADGESFVHYTVNFTVLSGTGALEGLNASESI